MVRFGSESVSDAEVFRRGGWFEVRERGMDARGYGVACCWMSLSLLLSTNEAFSASGGMGWDEGWKVRTRGVILRSSSLAPASA